MQDRICNSCIYNNHGWCTILKTNQGLKNLKNCSNFNSCDTPENTQDDTLLNKLNSMQKQLDEIQKIVTIIKNEMI